MYSLKHFRSTTIKWHKFLNSSIFICSNGFKWIYLFVWNKLIATQKNEFKQIIIFGINDFDQIFCKRSSAGSGQCCCRTQQPLSSIQRSRSVLSTFSSIQRSRSVLSTFSSIQRSRSVLSTFSSIQRSRSVLLTFSSMQRSRSDLSTFSSIQRPGSVLLTFSSIQRSRSV